MRGKPSPGTVIAIVALVAAMAGTATALPGRNSVDGGDLKPDSVKRSDIADGTLEPRNVVAVAANPQSGTDPCEAGNTAIFCGSAGPGGFWGNAGGSFAPVSFFADLSGVVHLGGTASVSSPANLGRAFILPPPFRPEGDRVFAVPCELSAGGQPDLCELTVQADGIVWRSKGSGNSLSLDGVTFPAD